jgi:prepilin-type N-terminal cleavage/methylation domain-containing protein
MREREAGFTLVEFVIAVAIATMLLAAGGAWMLSMRPGALRNAVNDFDSALAAARQLAATSGNGATLAFVPRTDNARGYELRVYSGRPTTSTAVIATSIRASVSEATISEATLGAPPFAIFLSSAGNPTGKA